jgi:hypothetical protein
MRTYNQQNTKIISPILMVGLVFGLFACNSPEQAAKLIGKKATQKVSQLCLQQNINAEDQFSTFESFSTTPSFSESLSDKTEIISTW